MLIGSAVIYLQLFGGGVKTNLSGKAIIATSLLATSLAFSSLSFAKILNNGEPIFVKEETEEFNQPNTPINIQIIETFGTGAVNKNYFGIGVENGNLTMDSIQSLNITYSDEKAVPGSNVVGIQSSQNSNLKIIAENDIKLEITANTAGYREDAVDEDGNPVMQYGPIYGLKNTTSSLNLNSKSGSIDINLSTLEGTFSGEILGINNSYGGKVDIDAGQNIRISTIGTVKGRDPQSDPVTNVIAIQNTDSNSEVTLDAGGFISLIAESDQVSKGISANSGTQTSLTSNGTDINASGITIQTKSSGNLAYGIENNQGSIKLTANNGNIYVSATGASNTNSALYAAGGTVNVKADGKIFLESKGDAVSTNAIFATTNTEDSFLIHGKALSIVAENNSSGQTYGALTIDGFASLQADELANIKSAQYGLYSYAVGSQSKIDLTGSTNKIEASSMALVSYGEKAALNINASGERTVIDENSKTDMAGTNFIIATMALWASNGVISLNANKANHIDASSYGLYIENSGTALLDVTNGVNRIEAGTLSETEGVTSGSGSAIYTNSNGQAEVNSLLGNNEIFGYIQVQNGQNSKATLTAGNNFISANANAIRAYTNGLVSVQANKTDQENSGNNFIYSKYANGYGEGLAIQALSKGSVKISAQETNSIFGAISSKNEGSSVSVDGKTNTVKSYAVISNAGNLNNATDDKFKDNRVISALYAEGKGARISLSGEENYLSTFADSSVYTDLERVVWAYDGADINIDGFTSITTDSYEKSLNSIDIAIAAGTAVNLNEDIVNEDVADRAKVQIKYANTTDSEDKAVLSSVTGDILSAYAGSVNIAPKSTTSDGLVVTGNLLAGNNGELTVDIGANGVLTGRADDYGDAGFIKDSEHTTFFDPAFSSEIFKGGQVNLKLGDNARWNVTGQSWITDISVADGAKNVLIDLVNANTDRNSTAHALTVYNLNGNATFNMSLDGNRDVSDMLYIRNANGEYNVNVVDAVTVDDMYKGGLNGLRFATVGAGSKAKFRAFTYDKGALNVEYEVATDSYDNNPENDIYNGTEMSHEKPGSTVVDGLFGYEEGAVATLALNDEAATKAADGTINETTNFKLVDRKDATPSDSGKTIIDHARANYANAVQLDTLNKRQGEMRFSQGHEDGLWARIRHDDIGKRSSFRLDNTMVEVGVDSRYVKETGEFHTGVAFDYMNGDTDYHHISGEGDLDRYGVWFYTTWLGNEGDYTDFIIKCSLIDNEYKIYAPTTGEKITGDYDNNVISVSLEHGKKYSNEESWFIEPQAQLQYAYVTSSEYTNSQGTDVRLDGIHSLIGRVGVRAGKDVTRDNPFTFYARGDIMHEFMGKQDIKAKDATGTMRVRYENDDTWYSAGLGMSYQHNKDKYYFLEAEKVFGGSNTSSYIVSGGVRFLFD